MKWKASKRGAGELTVEIGTMVKKVVCGVKQVGVQTGTGQTKAN